MAQFNEAFQVVIGHEGGYQANTNDSGNYNSKGELIGTKYGVSAPQLEQWLGWVPTAQDMKDISLDTARQIYREVYWDPPRLYELPDQHTATHIFDLFINHGLSGGARIVQRALGKLPDRYYTMIDGVYGPDSLAKTILAIVECCTEDLNRFIVEERVKAYKAIVAANPSQKVFLNGWLARAQSFMQNNPGKTLLGLLLIVGLISYLGGRA